MTIATGDSVVVEYTGKLADGEVFDTSRKAVAEEANLVESQPDREYAPLTVEIGSGKIIQGIEDALVGLETGATPTVRIPPDKGYGEWSQTDVKAYDREELSELVGGETPVEGDHLQTEDGALAEIVEVTDEIVSVDFNHSLAGKTLTFEMEILDVS